MQLSTALYSTTSDNCVPVARDIRLAIQKGTGVKVDLATLMGVDTRGFRVSGGNLKTSGPVASETASKADTLLLTLTDPGTVTTIECFRTNWDGVSNSHTSSTVVIANELHGWSLVKSHGEFPASFGFTVWSDGHNISRNLSQATVPAAHLGDKSWLELGDTFGLTYPSVGIERSVTTRTGAPYTFSLDYAGRIGLSADYTRIAVYIDEVKLGSYAGTSSTSALNWTNLQFSFTGNGNAQKIRIVMEGPTFLLGTRGAMVDNLLLKEMLPVNAGVQGNNIHLSDIHAALTDTDGSETLKVVIDGIPVGTVLTDGVCTFTSTNGSIKADVTQWNLSNLWLSPPSGFTGQFTLQVLATATELANGATATTAASMIVTVLPTNLVVGGGGGSTAVITVPCVVGSCISTTNVTDTTLSVSPVAIDWTQASAPSDATTSVQQHWLLDFLGVPNQPNTLTELALRTGLSVPLV